MAVDSNSVSSQLNSSIISLDNLIKKLIAEKLSLDIRILTNKEPVPLFEKKVLRIEDALKNLLVERNTLHNVVKNINNINDSFSNYTWIESKENL